jgi:chemotaxis protein histidine kinase CheA
MAIEKEVIINVKEKGLDSVNKKVKDLDESIGEVKGQGNFLSGATDGASKLSPAIGGAISGMKAMLVQMWAIVANPIGAVIAAIVLGLTALYKAFASTNDGADKLEQMMAGVSATIDVVRDRVLKVGEALKKFFSGDFKGAVQSGRDAVSGFGAEVEREFKQAANATKMMQEVADAARELKISRAKLDRDLAASKEIINSSTATYKEKKEAIEKVRIAEEKQTKLELENAKKKFDAQKALNKLSDTSDEDLEKEADAEAALYALQQQSAQNKNAIRKQEKIMQSEESSRLKAIADAKKAKDKEAADAAKKILDEKKKADEAKAAEEAKNEADRKNKLLEIQKSYELKIEDLADITNVQKAERQKARALAELEKLKATEEEKLNLQLYYDSVLLEAKKNDAKAKKEIDDKAAEEKIKTEKLVAQAKADIQAATLDNISAGIGLLKQIAGKNKGLQAAAIIAESAMGIAKIVINTQAANAAVTAKYALLPGGAALAAVEKTLNKVGAGIGIASNLLATKTALGALGQGGGGGSAPAMGGGASSAPAPPQFNIVGQNSNNQLAQSIGRQQSLPIEAYVVSGAVTSAQAMDRNRVKTATFN